MSDVIVIQDGQPSEEPDPDKGGDTDLVLLIGEMKAKLDATMAKVEELETKLSYTASNASLALDVALDAQAPPEIVEEPIVEETVVQPPIVTTEVTTIEMPEPPKADVEPKKKKGGFHLW